MRSKIYRTIRHDDGSKIQTFRYARSNWGESRTHYVSHNGRKLGCVVTYSDRTEVHPLLGDFLRAPSVAQGARMLVRMNGGMPVGEAGK